MTDSSQGCAESVQAIAGFREDWCESTCCGVSPGKECHFSKWSHKRPCLVRFARDGPVERLLCREVSDTSRSAGIVSARAATQAGALGTGSYSSVSLCLNTTTLCAGTYSSFNLMANDNCTDTSQVCNPVEIYILFLLQPTLKVLKLSGPSLRSIQFKLFVIMNCYFVWIVPLDFINFVN